MDVTEPGAIYQPLAQRAGAGGMAVRRTVLHKRDGLGGSAREHHPFYGLGADYVIADDRDVPACAIERKTLEDLARSASIQNPLEPPRIFRQLQDLTCHPLPLLLLEGSPSFHYRRVEPAILGIQFWCARRGIAIISSTTPIASASAIFLIARKLASEIEPGTAERLFDNRSAPLEPVDAVGETSVASDRTPAPVDEPVTEAAPGDDRGLP